MNQMNQSINSVNSNHLNNDLNSYINFYTNNMNNIYETKYNAFFLFKKTGLVINFQ